MSQNFSFLCHSSNPIPAHFTSRIASEIRHMVMISEQTKKVTLGVCTMTRPEKSESAWRKQQTMSHVDTNIKFSHALEKLELPRIQQRIVSRKENLLLLTSYSQYIYSTKHSLIHLEVTTIYEKLGLSQAFCTYNNTLLFFWFSVKMFKSDI